jgi:hypothetical protein
VRINPDTRPKLEEITNKALEKDRNLRYQHAADMRSGLRRLKRDTESGKSTATVAKAEVSKHSCRSARGLVAGAAAVILVAAFLA